MSGPLPDRMGPERIAGRGPPRGEAAGCSSRAPWPRAWRSSSIQGENMATRTLEKLVHPRVVLGLSRATNKQYITGAKAVVVAMKDNLNFPNPSPSLAEIQEAID